MKFPVYQGDWYKEIYLGVLVHYRLDLKVWKNASN